MTPSVATSTEGEIPSSYSLAQNYPNPFNPRTTIRYQLGQAEQARLVVYNILGREVAELATGQHAAGWHEVVWDGRDRAGRLVASGVYLYRLITPTHQQSQTMLLVK